MIQLKRYALPTPTSLDAVSSEQAEIMRTAAASGNRYRCLRGGKTEQRCSDLVRRNLLFQIKPRRHLTRPSAVFALTNEGAMLLGYTSAREMGYAED